MNLFGPIDMEALRDSFLIMGQGMGVILGVLILVSLIVLVLTKVTKGKDDKESE